MKILGCHEASLNCIYHPTYTFPAGWFFEALIALVRAV
jgi:hypothetical protein